MSTSRLSILLASTLLFSCAADDDQIVTGTDNNVRGDDMDASTSNGGASNGGGATPSSAGENGATNGTEPGSNGEVCETISIGAFPREPDILIVLDRSESMDREGLVKTMRWPPAVSAVKQVTTALQDSVRFGLMIFPNEASGCSSGLLEVPMQLNAAPAIATKLDAHPPGGATPMAISLRGAQNALVASRQVPDAVARDQYVLLITDGAPNCPAGSSSSNDPDDEGAYKAVDGLLKRNIKTYVIGFDTGGLEVLNELARRGGTGDTQHRQVSDAVMLVSELEKISRNVVPCTYGLDKDPGDPRFVRVEVDGKSYPYSPEGWQIENKTSIKLQPAVCDTLQDGKTHGIEITVECEPVVIL